MAGSSLQEALDGTGEPTPRWQQPLEAEDIALLDWLENRVCDMMTTEDTPENRLANEVYRVLHWVSAPHCRKNHPDWGNTPTSVEAGASA